MKNCDIIIPIYNAFDCLKKCIDSVFLHTNLENNRLLLIDDKSTDERIVPYIEGIISGKKQNIVFIKNEENLGFIKTVNFGMKFSNNDVLLLNTDTEVTTDWFDKIQKCAYSKERIATVTPLSNNATIASVPIFNAENEIPNDYNLEEYQALINNISYKEYGEIPTGIGFCFYIRREALDTVGYFDEESYGRAYGEEEDFCYRCLGHGYRHLLCDDVIVYHKSSQSLSDYHLKNIEIRQKTLQKKHPYYKSNTAQWVSNSPLIHINKNINLNLCINNKNSNILIIVHYWDIQKRTMGGTSLHIIDLIKKLKGKYNFHVFAPYNDNYRLYSYWRTGEETMEIISTVSRCYTNKFFNSEYSKILQNIIESLNVDIIHIHHMKGHFFDIVDIINIFKIKLIITLHDYYTVCPHINKLKYNNEYCGHPNEDECNYCLAQYNNEKTDILEADNIKAWKNVWDLLLSSASKIIVPSEAAKNEVLQKYDHLVIHVIEHGIDIERENMKLDIDKEQDFHIAFVGNLNIAKGMIIFEKLIEYACLYKDNIYFHLIGDIQTDISKMKYRHFVHHGLYSRNDLNKIFKENNIKLVCLFSIWPETYCYTLTESVSNNIPVLAIDEGAIGERVKKNNLGWLIKNGSDISEIYQTIKEIFKDKIGYRKVSESVSNYKIKNLEEMCNEYDRIYTTYKVNNYKNDYIEKLKSFVRENCLYNDLGLLKNDHVGLYDLQLAREKEQILTSYSWRIGRIVTWLPRKIKLLKKCHVKYKPIFTWSLSKKVQVYDISIEKSPYNRVIFKCGKTDPQIHFPLNKPINKPNGDSFIELKYINTLAGNLKIYYDWGVGFNENNTDVFSIEETSEMSTILMQIKNWRYDFHLAAFRVDPPDNTVFIIGGLKIIKEV